MIETGDLATLKAEGKIVLVMTSGFLGLGNFPESFSSLKRMTGLSDPALSKALKKLLRIKLIERTPGGKYILRARESEIRSALKPFYGEHLAEKGRLASRGLAKFDEVVAVILFGSVAQGKGDHDSDVDILIVLKNRDKVLEDQIDKTISELAKKLNVSIEPVFLSLVGLRTIAEREHGLLFGLMEGYRFFLDRANIERVLRAKERELKKRYEYDEKVGMWLPRR